MGHAQGTCPHVLKKDSLSIPQGEVGPMAPLRKASLVQQAGIEGLLALCFRVSLIPLGCYKL